MIGGKPTCPSCGNASRPAVACTGCGRATKRPGQSPGHEGLLCEPCRRRDTHATCRSCTRHRPIARRDDEGRPLCNACAGPEPVERTCPDCGRAVAGNGKAPCHACGIERRIAARAAASAPVIQAPWARDLFLALAASPHLSANRAGAARRMGAQAAFFAKLGETHADSSSISQGSLLAVFGNEGMRRHQIPVRFLAAHLGLEFDPAVAADAAERRRIEKLLDAASGRPWADTLRAYHDHLLTCAVAPKTVRAYLTAAQGLLGRIDKVGGTTLAALDQHQVDVCLRALPGYRASASPFMAWLAAAAGRMLSPGKARKRNPRRRERAVLKTSETLLARLAKTPKTSEGRALLAAAISTIHQVPLTKVLAIKTSEVFTTVGASVVVWPGRRDVVLDEALAAAFRLHAGKGRLAFPGRNPAQPLSTTAVSHHVRGRFRDEANAP